jgi:hypothetical protein
LEGQSRIALHAGLLLAVSPVSSRLAVAGGIVYVGSDRKAYALAAGS